MFQEEKYAFLSYYAKLKIIYEHGGIYLDVQNFTKYISPKDIPTLIRLLQRYRYFADLDGKVLDAITEE